MAVRAANLAERHLGYKFCKRVSPANERGNGGSLLAPDVIEVQHFRVGLATVNAWVFVQVGSYPCPLLGLVPSVIAADAGKLLMSLDPVSFNGRTPPR
jgi:hypothetical protein